MFQDGVSTVVTFMADVEDNHWRTYFEYNKGAFELIKVEHKAKYNGKPSLSTEDYQDITTIEGFTSFDVLI